MKVTLNPPGLVSSMHAFSIPYVSRSILNVLIVSRQLLRSNIIGILKVDSRSRQRAKDSWSLQTARFGLLSFFES
jgi:hypothetical protein